MFDKARATERAFVFFCREPDKQSRLHLFRLDECGPRFSPLEDVLSFFV
jgi:hypothetical protein